MSVSEKSFNKLSGANKYAYAQRAKMGRYQAMLLSGKVINYYTTHLPYGKGLTRLGEWCKKEGISWLS